MAHDVLVVGAGLTGLLFAKELATKGYRITILEKRPMPNFSLDAEQSKKRSMSMDISARGMKALKRLKLWDKVLSLSMPMTRKVFHIKDSQDEIVPYGRSDSDVIWAISRTYLHEVLLDECFKEPTIKVHFGAEVTGIQETNNGIIVKSDTHNFSCDVLIGADGLNSIVRSFIRARFPDDFTDVLLDIGYKELSLQNTNGNGLLENATHIWPRKNSVMIVAQPNLDSSYQVALIMPIKDKVVSFDEIKNVPQLKELFLSEWPDLIDRMPLLEREYFANPLGHLRAIKSKRLVMNHRIMLIGDAAHAMVPFFGQGANSGFEDCTIFFECLEDAQHDWRDALKLYEQRRVESANAIVDLSLTNYPELTHNIDIERYIFKRQVARKIAALTEHFLPFGDMVYFHHIPYNSVEHIKKIQEPILDRICKQINHVDDISAELIREEIGDYERKIKDIL